MNIGDYFRLGSSALWNRTIAAGVDDAYIETQKMSLFTAEQHIRYFSELRLGDKLSVHTRFLDRSTRAVHAMAFVVDREKDALACTLEAMLVHVSMEARSSVDMPDSIGASLDAMIAADDLPWPAPVCGVMGVRRR